MPSFTNINMLQMSRKGDRGPTVDSTTVNFHVTFSGANPSDLGDKDGISDLKSET